MANMITNNMKKWRLSKLKTQTEVALDLDVAKPLISLIESGKQILSIKMKRKIKDRYGVAALNYITGEDYSGNIEE